MQRQIVASSDAPGPRRWYSSEYSTRTAWARCIQGIAACTAAALSAVPFQAMHTRVPMVAGAGCGAISTGRPLSNSTACSASRC